MANRIGFKILNDSVVIKRVFCKAKDCCKQNMLSVRLEKRKT